MRPRFNGVLVSVPILLVFVGAALDAGQRVGTQRLSSRESGELTEMIKLVEAVQGGEWPGGDAYLTIQPHFLRGPDGETYIPFTLFIDEAPDGFTDIGMVVRVVSPEAGERAEPRQTGVDPTNVPAGEMPVSVPERRIAERRFGPGAPTPGESSAMLAAVERSLRRQDPLYPFQDVHFLSVDPPAAPEQLRTVQRAMSLPPGTYDVYIAIRERQAGRGEPPPKAAVMRRTLEVPDFATPSFSMSSVILADRIAPLTRPLSLTEQRARPYALGTAELTPALRHRFTPDEDLSVVFFVHDFSVDEAGHPDLSVEYRFFVQGIPEQLFQQTAPQLYGPGDAPSQPGGAAVRQMPISASVPLASFPDGPYRLEISVTDRLTMERLTESVRFVVEGGSAGSQ